MTAEERSDISNGIWLCRNCHKIVDADPAGYPPELLFEWRDEHERLVREQLGKTGAILREKVMQQHLAQFPGIGPLAQRIIAEKPYAWEYKLTLDILRTKLNPVIVRWRALEKGLYVRPLSSVPLSEAPLWCSTRFREFGMSTAAFEKVISDEFAFAWGAPGDPGIDTEIFYVCELLVDLTDQIVGWEERVRFARLPDEFERVHELMRGIGGHLLNEIARIPVEMGKVFDQERPTGVFNLKLAPSLPDGWNEEFEAAFDNAGRAILERFED